MNESTKKLIDRAAENVNRLRDKKFEELTPEDFGHVAGDLEGIILFVRAMDAEGVFDRNEELDKRVAAIEARYAASIKLAKSWAETAESRPIGMSHGFAEGLTYCAKTLMESISAPK